MARRRRDGQGVRGRPVGGAGEGGLGRRRASGRASTAWSADASGNLTYDPPSPGFGEAGPPSPGFGVAGGQYKYTYDAWNRLVKLERAYRNASDVLTTGSTVATMSYDALGRRIVKAIDNCGDFDATYHFYYAGQQLLQIDNGNDECLKQYVWGASSGSYVDELVQIGINQDPGNKDVDGHDDVDVEDEDLCERFFWVMQDANFNVLGVLSAAGDLVERYEYTPYGRRTIFSRGWLLEDATDDGVVEIGTERPGRSCCRMTGAIPCRGRARTSTATVP